MDRRQGETKRAGGGFGLSKPHKELLLPLRADADDTGYGKEEEMLLVSTAEAAAAGYRAAEGSSSRGIGGGVEDDKKRRLTPPFTSPPSSSLYASPAAARRGGVASTVSATGGGLGATTAASGVPASSQPCCQAERCTADLTEAKRYHRRHKVCETHSKAPVVAVAGLRQRFCQQCSRFHELSEFDDTKRSCRRRLAGHNERRRKSSADSQEEGPNSRCRQTDHNRKIQITMPGAAAATPAYKHFQIR